MKTRARKKVDARSGVMFLFLGFAVAAFFFSSEMFSGAEKVQVKDRVPREQAVQFIKYFHTLDLTREQEKIKNRALSSIPAPCCRDFSIRTCCCPCNLAKNVWGLTHFLIAERGYNVKQVKEAVKKWILSSNANGYAGNACQKGRCNKPFEKDGCGGMNEKMIS